MKRNKRHNNDMKERERERESELLIKISKLSNQFKSRTLFQNCIAFLIAIFPNSKIIARAKLEIMFLDFYSKTSHQSKTKGNIRERKNRKFSILASFLLLLLHIDFE